jgi:NTP pyrophosphatase (non-canonical NTP hydrolase)
MHDAETSIDELKQMAEQFRNERDWKQFHTQKDMAIDVAVEAAEILEHFRFRTNNEIMQFIKDPQKKQQISHEMADVLWGLLYLAIDMDIDLASAFSEKLKFSAKKYPVEKAKGVNKKYTEL